MCRQATVVKPGYQLAIPLWLAIWGFPAAGISGASPGFGDSAAFILDTEMDAADAVTNYGDSPTFILNTENPDVQVSVSTGSGDSPAFVLNTTNPSRPPTATGTGTGDSALFVLNTRTDSQLNVRDTVGSGVSQAFVLDTSSNLGLANNGAVGSGDSSPFVLNTQDSVTLAQHPGQGTSNTFTLNTQNYPAPPTDSTDSGRADSATFTLDTLQGAAPPAPVANTQSGAGDSPSFLLDTLGNPALGSDVLTATAHADSNTFILDTSSIPGPQNETTTSADSAPFTLNTLDNVTFTSTTTAFADSPTFTLNTTSSRTTTASISSSYADSSTFTLNTLDNVTFITTSTSYSDSNTFILDTSEGTVTPTTQDQQSYSDSRTFTLNTNNMDPPAGAGSGYANSAAFTLDTTDNFIPPDSISFADGAATKAPGTYGDITVTSDTPDDITTPGGILFEGEPSASESALAFRYHAIFPEAVSITKVSLTGTNWDRSALRLLAMDGTLLKTRGFNTGDAEFEAVLELNAGEAWGTEFIIEELSGDTSQRHRHSLEIEAIPMNAGGYAGIRFVDAGLENVLRAQAETPFGQDLLPSHIAGFTDIKAERQQISDLTGIEHASAVTQLNLRHNRVADLSPIENLTNLTRLLMKGNRLTDISLVHNLTQLDRLEFHFNEVTDISVVSGLPSITQLAISSNPLSDIRPVAALTNLVGIWMENSEVADLTPLIGLNQIESLNISGTHIPPHQLALITQGNFPALKYLTIQSLGLRTLTIFQDPPTSLLQLGITGNHLQDLDGIQNFTSINWLNASQSRIHDISALAGMTGLQQIFISENFIQTTTPLQTLSNLTDLNISKNLLDVTDGTPDKTWIDNSIAAQVAIDFTNQKDPGLDTDRDSVPDLIEQTLGTDKNNASSVINGANDFIWTGLGSDSNWSNPQNWDKGSVPPAGSFVYFGHPGSKDCVIDTLTEMPAFLRLASNWNGRVTLKSGFHPDGILELADKLIVENGELVVESTNLDGEGTGVTLKADEIKVFQNGKILAAGQGFPANSGPGQGQGSTNPAIGGGASHGGEGPSPAGLPPVAPYGSEGAPTSLGSGGNQSNGGQGGGAITLEASTLVFMNGTVSANAGYAAFTPNPTPDNNPGGGSGGSILVRTPLLQGIGTFQANGGYGYQNGLSGSGGRISLHEVVDDQFTGTLQVAGGQFGASGATQAGHPGTLINQDNPLDYGIGESNPDIVADTQDPIPDGIGQSPPDIIADTRDPIPDGSSESPPDIIADTRDPVPDGIGESPPGIIADTLDPIPDGEAESPPNITADTRNFAPIHDGEAESQPGLIADTRDPEPIPDGSGESPPDIIADTRNLAPIHDGEAESQPGLIADTRDPEPIPDGHGESPPDIIADTRNFAPIHDGEAESQPGIIADTRDPEPIPDGHGESPPDIIADTRNFAPIHDGEAESQPGIIADTRDPEPIPDGHGESPPGIIADTRFDLPDPNDPDPVNIPDGEGETPPGIEADTRDPKPFDFPGQLVARYLFEYTDSEGNVPNETAMGFHAKKQGAGLVQQGFGPFGTGIATYHAWWELGPPADTHPDLLLRHLTAGSFSVSTWFRLPYQLDADAPILANPGNETPFTSFTLFADQASGTLEARIRGKDGETTPLSSHLDILDNQWHEITLTVEPGGMASLYLDGILQDEAPQGETLSGEAPFLVGGPHFPGSFHNLRLYNYALLPEEARLHALLANGSIPENSDPGTSAGQFGFPLPATSATTELLDGSAWFQLQGNQLLLAQTPDYEQTHSIPLRIRSTLPSGFSAESIHIIQVQDLRPPIVGTQDPETGDVLVGEIIDNGGLQPYSTGFHVSPSPRFTEGNFQTVDSNQVSGTTFRAPIDGLTVGRTYYYKAFAENAEGRTTTGTKKFTATGTGTNTGPWASAQALGNGWYDSSIGIVYLNNSSNWAYHSQLGWIYVEAQTDLDIWLWRENSGWHWTAAQIYPYLHRHSDQTWLYLLGNENGQPVFYNATTGKIE